jgi:uncharacterized protein (DUF362 family)
MSVTLLTNVATGYPPPDHGFSPDEAYPEYPFAHVAPAPNPVYDAVRRLFVSRGLDKDRCGSPEWNPLRELVPEGSRVFVLCNFVYQRRFQESERDFSAKCIHGSVLRALCDYVLLAVGSEGSVAFGNAPLQAGDFQQVLADTGAARVEAFYREQGQPVRSRDLRLFVAPRNLLGRVTHEDHRDERDGVEFDLGFDSLLAPISPHGTSNFRISNYDPRRIQSFHEGGRHRYVIHRAVLDSDVVISLSKLKTHEKVGITCGLKGFVGSVGHKDCLAHHRFGSPGMGGDEYPDSQSFLSSLSSFHDWVNRRSAEAPLQALAQIADTNLRRAARRAGWIGFGAWHGNDTAWRMTLDLARIAMYGTTRGALEQRMQRRHLSLIDGVIAGEGEGPLSPTAVDAGTLLFGDDVAVTDRVAARVMGFDPERIALLREAFQLAKWPITDVRADTATECRIDGRSCLETELPPVLGRRFAPPRGWRQRLAP